MLTESNIDKSLLKDVIQQKFGITVVNFALVPKWEAARGYIIESSDHKSFFLKIYWDDKIPDSAFKFADDLFGRAGIVNIAHPIPTSHGQMRIQVRDFQIALFDWISGKTAQDHKLTDRQLEKLQRKVEARRLEFVNCHGEPSPGNVLSSDNDEVHLLDWDDPIFAPKEKDLLFFKGNEEPVMKGYSAFSKDTIIDRDALEFYGHMWNLGEIADYGGKLLFENHSDEQNQTWLDNLKGGWDFT